MNAAVFLQKTYDLIQSTPSDIAEWSNDGQSFVVKKIKDFEIQMLPRYFKHSNFASFSRQLRFYGFDKSKKHDIRIVQNNTEHDSCQGWWEFSNPHFLRDDPSQMVQIRRKTYSEPSSQSSETSEVSQLKRKMSTLQSQLSELTNQITMLTSVVHSYCQPETMNNEITLSPSSKKAKIDITSPVSVSYVWPEESTGFLSDDDIDSGILDVLLDFPSVQPLVGFQL